jgi:dTDP-4-dehydrorhamnose 3,5-epimerase
VRRRSLLTKLKIEMIGMRCNELKRPCPVIHGDARGFLIETYHKANFAALGDADTFVQNNHSRSSKPTLTTDKDPPAKPQETRRHLVDALVYIWYILLHGPMFINQECGGLSSFEPIYPNLGY